MPLKNTPITVILADDHEIFRDGFRVMLTKIPSIELLAEASNGKELIKLATELQPDVIITDIKMPELDGVEATKILTKEFPQTGIIAFSMFDEENLIVDMLEAGAKGYLIKNAQKEEIIEAVKTVFDGDTYYCRNTSMKLMQMMAQSKFNPYKKTEDPAFKENELKVIRLICQEKSNKEIAEELNLSKRTIEGYRENILEKIGAKNTAGIVMYALRHKIIS
jgi:DNA-binding NarL/FixJ family response regulator